MLWKEIPSGTTRAAEHLLWDAFGDQADVVAERINREKPYRDRIVRFALNGGFESTMDMRIARVAFGNRLWEPADWVRFFGEKFDEEQLQRLLQFPLHEAVLMSPDPWEPKKRVMDTHAAFLGIDTLVRNFDGAIAKTPLTVAQLIKMHPDEGKLRYFYPTSWHRGQPHIETVSLTARWHVLRIEAVPGSWGKFPEEHLKLLPPEYELPTTAAETAKDQFVFRKTGVRPNQNLWAHCAETTTKTDTCPAGHFSIVGNFDEFGLSVDDWHGHRDDDVGCGASRVF